MTFLFWNINGKQLLRQVAALVLEHNVDVLILAESLLDDRSLLRALRRARGAAFYSVPPLASRVRIYSTLPKRFVKPIHDNGYMSIRRIISPLGLDVLLVAMHLPSKLYHDASAQHSSCTFWSSEIREAEKKVGHSKTLVMGDMNMNPFELGMVDALGFHATMDRKIAARINRQVGGICRSFFYNPMWSHLGDSPALPPGTYFDDSGRQINYFWNMFDQVLLRPDLLSYYEDENLKILTSAGSESLVNAEGYPTSKAGSDHLPVLLQLWNRQRSDAQDGRLMG